MRTFVAIELPASVRRHLGDVQQRLKAAGADVRWVAPDRMHLTLVFLGDVPATEITEVAAAVEQASAGVEPVALQAAGCGTFPPRGRPRVVWAGIADPTGALAALQKAVADAAAPFAEKVDRRAYHPHLTLGRVRGGKGLDRLADAVGELADVAGPGFEADEVIVFRSDLGPGGPTYTRLAHADLVGEV